MSDCPVGCGWRYDPTGAAVMARPVGGTTPVVWEGALRVASASDAPRGRPEAIGAHVCFAHPMSPDVLVLGPAEEWTPLREFNAFADAYPRSFFQV